MSSNIPLTTSNIAAPTPQNTPMTTAPISQGLSRPTVPDIDEEALEERDGEDDDDDDEGENDDAAGAGAVQQAMMKMVHGRLATLVGKSSGYIENLPVEVKRTVEGLKGVQVEYEKLQTEFKRELLKLEEKYLVKYQPLFDRRATLVAGKAKATSAEIAAGEEVSAKDAADGEEEYTPLPAPVEANAKPTGIPEFWLTALRNHPGISELITDRDAGALKSLTDIVVGYGTPDGHLGFTLTFHFQPNDYFENDKLVKTYIYKDEIGYGGDFMYDRALGTTIKWKEDKDLTKEIEIKKQRNKNTNRTRVIRKSRPTDSFFNFFSPPDPPNPDAAEDEDDDDEAMEDLEERLELDYQIGEDLKERIVPRAVDYFTGKALEYDSLDDLDEEDEDDEFSEDGDDLDDDDSVNGAVRARRGPPKSGANDNVNPEECKQQ